MDEAIIEEALDVFENEHGPVEEANEYETTIQTGCLGCCDSYKCQME